jgi:methylated-DNA-protein-cysteine methyltransferase-like protein
MNANKANSFARMIYSYVEVIPVGRVMTYGQLAALCGSPRAARVVGGIAHYGPEYLPWHRVVNKQGGLAGSFPGGKAAQAQLLKAEGVELGDDFQVNIVSLLWWPPQQ